ncbi:hypothetical protein IL306_014891 [Fusarium sp. DS 682]|nr:hypothetical protein IL306_014891 [Fusarium sp. DS 682]
MASGVPRRRKLIGQRRRVEDEGEDEGGPGTLDLDDDSITDGSLTDDNDPADDSDTSNIDEASPTSPNARRKVNGATKHAGHGHNSGSGSGSGQNGKPVTDTDVMLHGLSITDQSPPIQEMHFDEVVAPSPSKSPAAPIVVSSASARPPAAPANRRRQEHEDYKRKRDEDPAFVPNRGAFFMHDHRHAGPAANGFRPFGRGRGRGGRGGIGGPFAPIKYVIACHFFLLSYANKHSQLHQPSDPTTNSPWTHDMHDTVVEPPPLARPRHMVEQEGPANGNGFIPTCEPNPTPINRTLSTEKHIGNAQVRVSLPSMKDPVVIPRLAVKQYTKLPDHRPPLRRDKPVRISLPNNPPRYIYPAADRSFIFIPRAMRPNQQRMRGKPRSGFGSMGGFSRRTSVFGGSYYGSAYSPSVAMSRRSSIVDRDYMFSPTGSVISRPPIPVENTRPVVRLPPAPRPEMPMNTMVPPIAAPASAYGPVDPAYGAERPLALETSINDLPPPQTYPLPQKPAFQENRPTSALPMHQPRPQKNISVADIESPTLTQGPQAYQQAFHQQVPIQMANGLSQESHTRQPSYPSQHSTGTPLSQIPERAIHAAPFQPNTYGQQPYYSQQPQQGYYYPPNYNAPNMGPSSAAPAFVPSQPGPPGSFTPQNQPEQPVMSNNGAPPATGSSLVVQEANGMVYYFDASQLPPVTNYSSYPPPQGYQPSVMGMGGMVTPSPDGFYYPQQASGMVYYPQ